MDEHKLLINKKILIIFTITGTILSIVVSLQFLIKSSYENVFLLFLAPIAVFFHSIPWLIVFIDLIRIPIRNKTMWFIGLFSVYTSLTIILFLINREKHLRLYKRCKTI